jgi:hypothetical protein
MDEGRGTQTDGDCGWILKCMKGGIYTDRSLSTDTEMDEGRDTMTDGLLKWMRGGTHRQMLFLDLHD